MCVYTHIYIHTDTLYKEFSQNKCIPVSHTYINTQAYPAPGKLSLLAIDTRMTAVLISKTCFVVVLRPGLCSYGCPWTCNFPISLSWVLGLWICITIPATTCFIWTAINITIISFFLYLCICLTSLLELWGFVCLCSSSHLLVLLLCNVLLFKYLAIQLVFIICTVCSFGFYE